MSEQVKNLGRESNTITISTFYENHLLKKYNFNPSCQRDSVWDEERESFLIDSIIKNFSIPAIFLYQKIDEETGKTMYDVIDGKQRLTSIIKFIENKIPLPDDYSKDTFGDIKLDGIYFNDLKGDELSEYKKNFWRYNIPVEYIDTEDQNIIDTIFDRLNRNGVPLSFQELRKAQFNKTPLFKLIVELGNSKFWEDKFIKTKRMEDTEFISEIIFVLLEKELFNSSPKDIDLLYERYKDIDSSTIDDIKKEFIYISSLMENLELDYKKYHLGVSHMYAVWCFCLFSDRKGYETIKYKENIQMLYKEFRNKDKSNNSDSIKNYRASINGGSSKGKSQRRKRVQAIFDYCNIEIKL